MVRFVAALAAMLVLSSSFLACDRPSIIRPAPTPTATSVPVPAATSTTVRATPTAPPTPTRVPPTPTAPAQRTPTPTARVTYNPGDLIISGPPNTKKVAMTFDMGSVGGATLVLLDELKARRVPATFFVTGKWVEDNPSVLKAIVAGGHEVANHSYNHPDFTTISQAAIIEQLGKTEEIVKKVAGVSTKPYFRPPFGAYNATVVKTVAEQGYKSIYWTVDGTDWRDDSTTSSVIAWTLKNIQPGGILIMHGAVQKTAEAVPTILEGMFSRGMQPGNLSDLLKG